MAFLLVDIVEEKTDFIMTNVDYNVFAPGAPSKLTLEQGDYIYECVDPSITLTSGLDCIAIEARCWQFMIRKKENMETESLVEEVRKIEAKEKKKIVHPDFDDCACESPEDHVEAVINSTKKAKKKVKARTDRFPKDGGRPIKASVPGYAKIPWTMGTLTLIAQSPDGQLHYAKTIEEKKQLAWGNFKWIIVCWPGKYSQDIFLIDDMTAFRKALGFKKKSEAVVLDEEGEEWIYELLFPPKAKTLPITKTSTLAYPTYAGYGKDGW